MEVINGKVKYIRPLGYDNLKSLLEDENYVYIARKGVVFVKGMMVLNSDTRQRIVYGRILSKLEGMVLAKM
jgi:hypothetical protein